MSAEYIDRLLPVRQEAARLLRKQTSRADVMEAICDDDQFRRTFDPLDIAVAIEQAEMENENASNSARIPPKGGSRP